MMSRWFGHRSELQDAYVRLATMVVGEGFAGWDPYDALNSRVLSLLTGRSKWLRIAAIQLLKRSSVNLRPALGIRKAVNPKGLGLFLSAFARRQPSAEDPADGPRDFGLVGMIEGLASSRYSGAAWGYHFPWQSRAFFVPAGVPTAVNTAFVANGLLDWHEVTGDERPLALARSACDFILGDLHRTTQRDAHCFSYTPLDRTHIHNANALAGALLARVGRITHEEQLREGARRCARFLLSHQRPDGSWPYADTEYQGWVDSFHTGFVLDSLLRISRDAPFEEGWSALERGFSFFEQSFFERDGSVRYYADSLHPIDIHCPTQAIVTLVRFWKMWPRTELLDRVSARLLKTMLAPEGYFFYRLGWRGRPNRINYVRWSQGWGLLALGSLLELIDREGVA
jgi:hypothetical protein